MVSIPSRNSKKNTIVFLLKANSHLRKRNSFLEKENQRIRDENKILSVMFSAKIRADTRECVKEILDTAADIVLNPVSASSS